MAVGAHPTRSSSSAAVTPYTAAARTVTGFSKKFPHRPGHAHLVGIGGSGMRALARVLHKFDWRLSGSDVHPDGLDDVLPPGTRLHAGHNATGLPATADVVIHSDAIGNDNPELEAARDRNVAILSYFDAVGRIMEDSHGLAVAGTHGKSTTTAMAAWILVGSGRDPTVLCGATTIGANDGGRAGRSGFVLAEACEYRANFLKLRPRHAVILGIEPDHFDCYAQPADVERAFAQFAAGIAPDGLLLARGDCAATRRVAAGATCRFETFALDETADWTARSQGVCQGCHRFELVRRGQSLCRIVVPMPGRHNMLNTLAAAALAWHQGVEPSQIAEALDRFPGVRRRLEPVGTWSGAAVVDDYAHHPTELAAALETVRQTYPNRRICCVFQPHQVSRTAHLLDELASSLHNGLRSGKGGRPSDRLWIADIFRAREGPPRTGEVTAADLADRVRRAGLDVAATHRMDEIGRELNECLGPGDVLLVAGAGNIHKILSTAER
ncbi:MAG: UDP-N-acetylmuramate--L-alanine ligase [Pirellulales bacterium]|nr:UDP-N-acetylmuramate--L-alanine ligase [Pirellulales bacterium]